MKTIVFIALMLFVTIVSLTPGYSFANQNVLLIIADDLGVDVLNIDHTANTVQVTTALDSAQQAFDLPNLSTLLANGVYFTNTWATSVCSPTRATLYTGLQPWKTGVGWAVGNYILKDKLPDGTPVKTIANAICDHTKTRTCGLFGKWHLGGDNYESNPDDSFRYTPLNRGWDYYAGNLGSHLHGGDTYSSWTKFTANLTKDGYAVEGSNGNVGASNRITRYATQDVVNEAKAWIADQTGTWFATLAFNAPHDPFHVPPDSDTFGSSTDIGEDEGQYNAMNQSLDYYIGKLWDSSFGADINDKLRNTLIIFLGDNGTPRNVANIPYELNRAKKTVYLGGIHVPLIVADGAKVLDPNASPTYLDDEVVGEIYSGQVNVADLYQTIINLTGAKASPGFGTHSYDLSSYLRGVSESKRRYNFTQQFTKRGKAHASISNGLYKLNYQNGDWELFNIARDPEERHSVYSDPASNAVLTELLSVLQKHQKTSDDNSSW